MSKIDELIAAEGEAAEGTEVSSNAKGARPGRSRSVMFSLRLNPEELAELERYAEQRGLPARTLARAWILARLHDEGDLGTRVARLERAVFHRSA